MSDPLTAQGNDIDAARTASITLPILMQIKHPIKGLFMWEIEQMKWRVLMQRVTRYLVHSGWTETEFFPH